MSKGVIFKYMDKNGVTVKAVALNDEQDSIVSKRRGKAKAL